MKKDWSCIARTTLLQEVLNKIEGLGHGCRKIADEVGLPNLMCIQKTKNEIKRTIKNHDREETRQKVENITKVGNRITDNPEDCCCPLRFQMTVFGVAALRVSTLRAPMSDPYIWYQKLSLYACSGRSSPPTCRENLCPADLPRADSTK